MAAKLTVKQKRFIEAYSGNATAAALEAGYSPKVARSIGAENLTKPDILSAIREREAVEASERIANRQERQAFWTALMRGEAVDVFARLKASELLAKSEGDFLERLTLENINPPVMTVHRGIYIPAEGEYEDD